MNAAPASAPRGRLQLILLATLFFLPLLASYALYFLFPGFQPEQTTNFGTLVHPARPVPELRLLEPGAEAVDESAIKGRWTYLVRSGVECEERCLRALVMSRQVRKGLNEKRSRIQRVLLAPDQESASRLAEQLAAEHPQLRVLAEDQTQVFDEFLSTEDADLYLFDPLGNWLMVYPRLSATDEGTREDFKGIRKDIKKLLRISQIG